MTKAKKTTARLAKRRRAEASTSELDRVEGLAPPSPLRLPSRPSPHPIFLERYTHLKMKWFGKSHLIDWPVLTHLGLKGEVRRMVDFEGVELASLYDINLKVLSTFEVDRSPIGFSRKLSKLSHILYQVPFFFI